MITKAATGILLASMAFNLAVDHVYRAYVLERHEYGQGR